MTDKIRPVSRHFDDARKAPQPEAKPEQGGESFDQVMDRLRPRPDDQTDDRRPRVPGPAARKL